MRMNARYTMLFETKKEREQYIRLAESQEKSLGKVIRELLAQWASQQNSEGKAA